MIVSPILFSVKYCFILDHKYLEFHLNRCTALTQYIKATFHPPIILLRVILLQTNGTFLGREKNKDRKYFFYFTIFDKSRRNL